MTNHDLVKKVIGKIRPVGESNTDDERLENLKEMCHLVEMLLMDIIDLRHDNRNDKRASVKMCVDYADKFLNENIRPLLPDGHKEALTSLLEDLPEVNELTCKDHAIGQGYYKSKIKSLIQNKLK